MWLFLVGSAFWWTQTVLGVQTMYVFDSMGGKITNNDIHWIIIHCRISMGLDVTLELTQKYPVQELAQVKANKTLMEML